MIAADERALVISLRNNKITAFDALYERYHTAVYTNIFKLIRNEEQSKDMLQEVFLALWEKRKTLDPERSIGGWLFTVSYHKSIQALRQSLRLSLVDVQLISDSLSDATPADTSETERKIDLLREAIEKLSPQKKRVFQLCKVEGKTYEETAKELHISKHTVKEYLSYSVAQVREFLAQDGSGRGSSTLIGTLTGMVCSLRHFF